MVSDEQDEHRDIDAGPEGAADSGGEQLAWILHERVIQQPACQEASQRRRAIGARRLVKS
jgi:hypothetical protein